MTAKKTNNQPQDKSLANKVIELIINDCELVAYSGDREH